MKLMWLAAMSQQIVALSSMVLFTIFQLLFFNSSQCFFGTKNMMCAKKGGEIAGQDRTCRPIQTTSGQTECLCDVRLPEVSSGSECLIISLSTS